MQPIPELKDQLTQAVGLDNSLRTALAGVEHEIPKSMPAGPAYGLCRIALEHGSGNIRLFADDNPIPACALLRLQYEAVVRVSWLLYGAPKKWLIKASGVMRGAVTPELSFPPVSAMLLALHKSDTTPIAMHNSLAMFESKAWTNLNSFVHGGFMSITRALHGHEPELQLWMMKSSSTLSYVASMLCATISHSQDRVDNVYKARQSWPHCFHALPREADNSAQELV